jgi:hypothetical protein
MDKPRIFPGTHFVELLLSDLFQEVSVFICDDFAAGYAFNRNNHCSDIEYCNIFVSILFGFNFLST